MIISIEIIPNFGRFVEEIIHKVIAIVSVSGSIGTDPFGKVSIRLLTWC